jgi:DNA-binding CsgD family transcriptional regulator
MADARLRKAIGHALSPTRPPGPAAVQIPRLSLRRAYQVAAAPLRSRFRQFVGMPSPVAVLLITDPEQSEPASTDLLIQLYGLTPKEAALAAKLSEGKSVEQAAEELTISYETARTHLRRVFGKTETSRQTELLLLMARLPPAAGNGKD